MFACQLCMVGKHGLSPAFLGAKDPDTPPNRSADICCHWQQNERMLSLLRKLWLTLTKEESMIRWFADEWGETPMGWRIFLVVMLLICLLHIAEGLYAAADVFMAIQMTTFRLSTMCMVLILPFVIAAKARKRSRRFGLWLILAMVFNPIVIGIVYWISVRKEIERPAPDDSTVASFEASTNNHQS